MTSGTVVAPVIASIAVVRAIGAGGAIVPAPMGMAPRPVMAIEPSPPIMTMPIVARVHFLDGILVRWW